MSFKVDTKINIISISAIFRLASNTWKFVEIRWSIWNILDYFGWLVSRLFVITDHLFPYKKHNADIRSHMKQIHHHPFKKSSHSFKPTEILNVISQFLSWLKPIFFFTYIYTCMFITFDHLFCKISKYDEIIHLLFVNVWFASILKNPWSVVQFRSHFFFGKGN